MEGYRGRKSLWTILSAGYAYVAYHFIVVHLKLPHPVPLDARTLWDLGIILIGPPLWFLAEFHFLYKGEVSEHLKYTQELASRLWAAVALFATALILGKG